MKITRREALKLGLAGTGSLLSPLSFPNTAQAAECTKQPPAPGCPMEKLPDSPLNVPLSPPLEQLRFKSPLFVPQKLQPIPAQEISGNHPDIDYYQITMKKERVGVVFDEKNNPIRFAEFWTYNGITPGPLIRQKTGRQSCIRFINQLGKDKENKDICASVHLHGMASLPQYDGYANDLIPVNYCKDYYYPNIRASTLWYHDHAVHKTSRNVYMGLAGMYVVEYKEDDFCSPEALQWLPKDEFEIPLIIQDKTFRVPDPNKPSEWELVFNDRQHRGVYADIMLVNGRAWPTLKVKRQKYYFRILNASASRTYQLALSRKRDQLTVAGDSLFVVGSDAGLLSKPEPLVAPNQPLRIGVAERYGIVIDFAQFPPDQDKVYLWDMGFPGNIGAPSQALMQFELEGDRVPSTPPPAQLGIVTLQDELIRVRNQRLTKQNRPITRADQTFRFGRGQDWTINGKTWSADFVAAKPGLWDVEIWELVNMGGWVHPVHIHLIDFQILERNGQKPAAYERGWKDVVVLNDLDRVRVIASFNPQPGKYMMHCHNIVHEDHDMMTQFEVQRQSDTDPPIQDPFCAPAKPCSEMQPLGAEEPPLYKLSAPTYGKLKNSCPAKN